MMYREEGCDLKLQKLRNSIRSQVLAGGHERRRGSIRVVTSIV